VDSNNGGSAGRRCLYGCSSAESPLATQFLHHPPTDEGTMTKMTMTAATTTTMTTTTTTTKTYWCCGHILHAAVSHFVLRRFFLCCGIVLRAVAMLFVQWQENDAPQRCMAFRAVVSSCIGKKRPAVVPRRCLRQETTCRSMRHCRSSFCSKKRRAAAVRDIARHGVLCRGFVCCAMATRMKKTINLCSVGRHSGVVAFVLALLVVVFFVEVVALLVF